MIQGFTEVSNTMNKQQLKKWFLEVANQEYDGNIRLLMANMRINYEVE